MAFGNPFGKRGLTVDVEKPGSIEAALRRSLRAAVMGDWLGTETWLERIVEADTTDLDAYYALARLYREQGAIGRAIRMHQNLLLRTDLERAGQIDALLELARDFDVGGYAERAAAAYEEVLDAQPKNAEALRRLVVLLQDLHEYPRALSLAKRLRRVDRGAGDEAERSILLSQAQAGYSEGDHDGARGALNQCLRRDKKCGPAWALLGEIEAERGKNARALDAWRQGVTLDPSVGRALYPKLAASYSAKGKPQEYEKLLRRLLEERPTDSAVHVALARLLAGRGEAGQAIEDLSRAIEVVPSDSSLRVELGRQLLSAGQEAEALKAYAGLLDAIERADADSQWPLAGDPDSTPTLRTHAPNGLRKGVAK